MCRFALIEHSCFKPYPLAGVFCLLDIFVITPLISFKSYPLAGVFCIFTQKSHGFSVQNAEFFSSVLHESSSIVQKRSKY